MNKRFGEIVLSGSKATFRIFHIEIKFVGIGLDVIKLTLESAK